jgi:class 3 adenylate cyclase/TolB-like protein
MNVVAYRKRERRLAAILAADVAGYSRLVEADELGTLAQWQVHCDSLVEPKIRSHEGRIVRTSGDGVLAEFASVVNAVQCAVELQRGMAERNAGIPQEKRIEFRIGINVGDIIVDRGDIWGDGVNVAARLEALAEPGGICVSGRVQEDVQGKLSLVFEDAGEQRLKNIARPVRVYRVRLDEVRRRPENPPIDPEDELRRSDHSQADGFMPGVDHHAAVRRRWPTRHVLAVIPLIVLGAATSGAWWLLASRRSVPTADATYVTATSTTTLMPSAAEKITAPTLSIVVLPFLNLGADKRGDDLADGITDGLTTYLLRALPGSFVVARDVAFTYKGKTADLRQIGRELNVRYVLEGSVRPDGDLVRVSARFINAETGGPVWAERFDLTRSDIQQVQDDIVRLLSRTIDLKMIDAEMRQTDREKPNTGRGVPVDLIRSPELASETGIESKAQAPKIQPEGACARDAERLARLRADPTMDAIARFERELGCERLRPQLRRLRESVGQ